MVLKVHSIYESGTICIIIFDNQNDDTSNDFFFTFLFNIRI